MEHDDVAQHFLLNVCRSLVSLTGTYVIVDSSGRSDGPEQFFNYSGFIISFRGIWALVTAGHALEELRISVDNGQIQLRSCYLQDGYGIELYDGMPVPFGFQDAKWLWLDDESEGFDVALTPLSPVYQRTMQDRILPFVVDNWREASAQSYDHFGILGLPNELLDRTRRASVTGTTIVGSTRPALLFGSQVDAQSEHKPAPRIPWLAIKLRDNTHTTSMVGMSGGPIIGFQNPPDGGIRYRAIGIQSWWDKNRRIAFGTAIWTFMELLEAAIEDEAANQDGA